MEHGAESMEQREQREQRAESRERRAESKFRDCMVVGAKKIKG